MIDPFALPGATVHYPPDRKFDLEHLRLEVSLDTDGKSVRGSSTITFTALVGNLRRIDIDAVEMSIKSVKDQARKSLAYDYTGRTLQAYFDRPLAIGEKVTLRIEYEATPRRGLYFIAPDEAYPNKHLQVWSHGEPEDARYWFPCYDYPNDRMTSEVIATVPDKFVVISNGRLLDVLEDKANRTRTYHWSQEVPHVSYLLSIVAGEFAEIRTEWGGIPITNYVPKEHEKDALRSFEKTPKMMKFFSDVTGVKYPYPKYAQLTVEDFLIGGEENISATTFTQEILHDERAHLDYSSDPIVAHELSHQWFGDLLTCKDWSHIWLNESFATYFDATFTEYDLGREEFQARLLEYYDSYLEEAREKYRRPIVTRTYHDPDELFDRHTYPKGGLVLHTLRYTLGDDMFWKVIRTYVGKFRDKVVETADFKTTIEEITGRSTDLFFEQWLLKPGHPELTIKPEWKAEQGILELHVDQTQDTSDGTPIFQFEAELLVVDEDGENLLKLNITDKSHVFQIPLDRKPLSVVLDPDNWMLKTVKYEKPQQMLLFELKNGKSIMTRIWAAQTLANFRNSDVVRALKESMANDPFWKVQAEAAKALGSINTEAALDALVQGASVKHPKARRAVVKALGEFKTEKAAEALLRVLAKDESYFVEAEAAKSLGKTKSSKSFDTLQDAFRTKDSFREVIKARILEGFGELKDERALPILLTATKYGQHFRIRQSATKALAKFGHSDGKAFERLTELLKDKNHYVRTAAIEALEEIREPRALADLDWVVEHELDGGVKRAARHAIFKIREHLEKSVEWRKLQDEIEQLKQENRRLRERIDTLESRMSKDKT